MQSLDRISDSLDRALHASPADFTEIVWLETRRRCASTAETPPWELPDAPQQCVLVRVMEGGLKGFYRTGHYRSDSTAFAGLSGRQEAQGAQGSKSSPASGTVETLDCAVRQALAQARSATPAQDPLPSSEEEPAALELEKLYDPRLAELQPEEGRGRLQQLVQDSEKMIFRWGEAHLVVAHSTGLRRRIRLTAAELFVLHGEGPGAGFARSAARTLEGLDALRVVERSRQRSTAPADVRPPESPVLLAPEATAAVLTMAVRELSRRESMADDAASPELPSWSPRLEIYDDGAEISGLPLPFDFTGTVKKRIDLVREGRWIAPPRGAALAVGGDERQASNLFMGAGDTAPQELLEAAEGGLWISGFEDLACLDPGCLSFAGRGRGLRTVSGGRLSAALPAQLVRVDLDKALGQLIAVGQERVCIGTGDGLLSSCCAPALVYRP